MKERYGCFTNNSWQYGTGIPFQSFDPATGESIWQGHSVDESQVRHVVHNAKLAFDGWASLTLEERSKYLFHFGEILKESREHLAETISLEIGKPLWESLSEVDSMINKIPLSMEAYENRCKDLVRELPHARSLTRHRPHGVLAVLGPFNFPGHLPNGHIIPALLAGNTIILKPSELAPLVSEKIIQCWEKTSLPPGVINLVQGGKETGRALVHDTQIDGVLFTGSENTGCALSQLFASQPSKILALEMGGNNPLVVGEIDDLVGAAYLIIQSAYLTSGQRCTCARRLIIQHSPRNNELLQLLSEMIQTIRVGSYTDQPEPFMGPVISSQQAAYLIECQMQLKEAGGILLNEMHPLKAGTGFITPGLMDVTLIKNRKDEEIFGPFLQVIRVKDFHESIEESNKTKFGLAAGLLSNSEEEYHYFHRQVKAGIINWNTPLTGASSAAPFGGIKSSGNFRPSAYYAADYCAYPVASFETPRMKMPETLLPGISKIGGKE